MLQKCISPLKPSKLHIFFFSEASFLFSRLKEKQIWKSLITQTEGAMKKIVLKRG